MNTFSVPRFKMQNKFNLRSVLPTIGISDAFSPTAADFTGISGKHEHTKTHISQRVFGSPSKTKPATDVFDR